MKEIGELYSYIEDHLGIPRDLVLQTSTGPVIKANGEDMLMFGSYNYLGLANNDKLKEAAIKTINEFGVGTGGVRLLTGTMDIHKQLEMEVARFTSYEDCMTIASGYGTNVGVIPGIINLMGFGKSIFAKKAAIFSDEFNHASIVDGCRLSEAKKIIFSHNNFRDLESKISKFRRYRKLIVTDGVFSMDGDVAPLAEIIDIAKTYDAYVMVDDAHAFGCLGDTGSGTAEYVGRKGQVHINMGTFSKGIGVSGGFVAGKTELISYLRLACRSYMFSDSLSPGVVGAVRAAIRYILTRPAIVQDLQRKADYFRSKLKAVGFNTYESKTHIVPIYIGDEQLCMKFTDELFKKKVIAPAIRWPAVPRGSSRIRFAVSAAHSYEQIDKCIEITLEIGRRLNIISAKNP